MPAATTTSSRTGGPTCTERAEATGRRARAGRRSLSAVQQVARNCVCATCGPPDETLTLVARAPASPSTRRAGHNKGSDRRSSNTRMLALREWPRPTLTSVHSRSTTAIQRANSSQHVQRGIRVGEALFSSRSGLDHAGPGLPPQDGSAGSSPVGANFWSRGRERTGRGLLRLRTIRALRPHPRLRTGGRTDAPLQAAGR